MRNIVFLIVLVISIITMFPVTSQAQKPYLKGDWSKEDSLIAQIQEMERIMGNLKKEITEEHSSWIPTGFKVGGVSGLKLPTVRVETYVSQHKGLETDFYTQCEASVNYDEIDDVILFFYLKTNRKGKINEIEYDTQTQELFINEKEEILNDQQWMLIGNICAGDYTVIK